LRSVDQWVKRVTTAASSLKDHAAEKKPRRLD
jgi:hypothetical protein